MAANRDRTRQTVTTSEHSYEPDKRDERAANEQLRQILTLIKRLTNWLNGCADKSEKQVTNRVLLLG